MASRNMCLEITRYNNHHRSINDILDYIKLCVANERNTQGWTCMRTVIEHQHKKFIYAENEGFKN